MRRVAVAWGALCAWGVVAACHDGGPAPHPPAPTLRVTGGDAQESRVADAPLPASLTVTTVDPPTGRALADVPLVWSTADGRVDGDARSDAAGQGRATWRLAPRVGPQTAVARVGYTNDSVVFHARLLAAAVRLAAPLAGDTLVLRAAERARLAWQVVDSAGTPLEAPAVRWAGADPAVATVTNDGVVTGVADGVTTLTPDAADLAALGVRQPPPRVVVVVGAAPLAGSVHPLDAEPGEAVRGLRVTVRTSAGAESADVGADGRFQLRASPTAFREATEVVVDAADPAARRWIPAVYRWTPGSAPAPLRFLLVPRVWRVAAGAYRGQQVPVTLNAALGAGIPDPPAGTPWYDRSWFYKQVAPLGTASGAPSSMEAWPDDAFPIPVYLDRERSRYPVAASDSVNLWRNLDAMHATLGETLFRPAEKARVADPRRAVAVVIDSTLYDGLSASTWTTTCAPRDPALDPARDPALDPGCAGVVDRAGGTLFFSGRSGSIRNKDLVEHEVGHVLGLGHTCYWSSIMYGQLDFTSVVAPSCQRFWLDGAWPSGFLTRADDFTARDVAHLELYRRAAAALRRVGAAHGLYAAFLGERRLLLGLDREGTGGGP